MVTNYGTWEIRYCIASVWVDSTGVANVSYRAFSNDGYGLHLVENIDNSNILWYDTEAEAKKHILNSNECIIFRGRDIKREEA